jgi:hypothetical protein
VSHQRLAKEICFKELSAWADRLETQKSRVADKVQRRPLQRLDAQESLFLPGLPLTGWGNLSHLPTSLSVNPQTPSQRHAE